MSYLRKIQNRLSELMKNNKFLIVISILIAFGLWCFVALTVNTEGYGIIRNVPVEFTTGSNLSELSVVTKSVETVDITVYGSRSVVGVLSAEDFVVRADYSNIAEAGNYTLNITVESAESTNDYKISSTSKKSVDVFLDRIISRRFEIDPELIKASVPEGFVLQTPSLSRKEVTLTGAESEMAAVTSCVARVNVNAELTETKTYTAKLEYRNADGGAVNLKNITADISEVELTASVLKEKEVSVKFEYTNVPAGFDKNKLSYTLSQSTIRIAGPAAAIDDLTEINIGYIDLAELTLDGSVEIPVTLPTGMMNLEEIDTITVTFDFSNFIQKIFSTQNITVSGTSSKYEITVLTKRISRINVIGNQSVLTSLTANDIVAEIDISSLGEIAVGTQTVPVNIRITSSDEAWATGDYTANVSVRER